jgi:hypothetical protein
MSWTASWRIFASAILLALSGCATQPAARTPLFADDFRSIENWVIEAESPARVVAVDGVLDIDSPAGVTMWFKPRLSGPIEIEFTATAVSAGGANDQVSDLNVFWMASNRDGSAPFHAQEGPLQRSGAFAEYHDLLTYYVGLGGNRNTTTRFRRYIGDPNIRPLLPEHDLAARNALLVANKRQIITLLADGSHIEYRRDGHPLFTYDDPTPYTQGWFAFRTTYSHLRIERLKIYTLETASNSR